MAMDYTREQLNSFTKDVLIELFLSQQELLKEIDRKQQLILEQIADSNRHRYGRSSEKMVDGQLTIQVGEDGQITFNEAEEIIDAENGKKDEDDNTAKKRGSKRKGKKEENLAGLPVEIIKHELTDKELTDIYGDEGWKRLPDKVMKRYLYTPAKIGVEEHHVAVYSGKTSEKMTEAPHPKMMFRNSLLSPSLGAGILNGKYSNAVAYQRIEREMADIGVNVTRREMARWTIMMSERYLSLLYDVLHRKLYESHVIQADETPLIVNKDGREAGSKSYMWVYRTGEYEEKAIVLFEYQKTRKAEHPREFLKEFQGVCVTDGYQVYHTIEKDMEDLNISGCWSHARRRYDEALKALPEKDRKESLANKALSLIKAISTEEGRLKDLAANDRREQRQLTVKPLVEAYFEWVKEHENRVLRNSKTHRGFTYSLNQERYLKAFLDDGEIPMTNNAAERAIRPFCLGKKNWVFCDTVSGAKASAVVYSICETAKANKIKVYDYFKHLLTEIPEHMDDKDTDFIEDLLPWSDKVRELCKK